MDSLHKLFGLELKLLNSLVKATESERLTLEADVDSEGWSGIEEGETNSVLLALENRVALRGHVIACEDSGVWISAWHSVYQFEGAHQGRILFVPFAQIVMAEVLPIPDLPPIDRLVSQVENAVVAFQMQHGTWSGTASELLSALSLPDGWPNTPHKLIRRITESAPLIWNRGVAFTRAGRTGVGTPVFKICAVADLVTAPQEAQADA